MPRGGTRIHENGARGGLLHDPRGYPSPDEGRLRNWWGEPAGKFGPDIATHPRLSPPLAESTHNRLFDPRMSPEAGTQPADLMELLYLCCAGLDAHKDALVACVRRVGKAGRATICPMCRSSSSPALHFRYYA
jgi:hypothetical protein